MKLDDLVSRLVPDPAACRQAADALRRDHPGEAPAELARRAIHSAKVRAATAGAATGMASSPLTMIPAALADLATVMKIEATLVGVIAALLEPAALDDPKAIRADVIGVIFPAAASQALRQVGIRATERLSQAAMRKYATEDLVRTLTRFAARFLGKKITREAIVAKAVPLLGIGIGAGWNWLEVQAIGARAIHYYTGQPIGPLLTRSLLATPKLDRRRLPLPKVARFLPGKREGEPAPPEDTVA